MRLNIKAWHRWIELMAAAMMRDLTEAENAERAAFEKKAKTMDLVDCSAGVVAIVTQFQLHHKVLYALNGLLDLINARRDEIDRNK